MLDDDAQLEIARLRAALARQQQILDATRSLHESLDVGEVLGRILAAATSGVDAARGTVFLLSEDRKELWSRVLSGAEHREIRLPVGKGIAGTVATTGETVRIDDAWEDARFDKSWDMASGFRTRQMLCSPVSNRNGVTVGVFQLLNKKSGNFTVADEEYLAELSVHAALAVENAHLHRSEIENERREREMGLALGVQRQLQPERLTVTAGRLVCSGINELCEDASGDYYDMIRGLPGGRVGVAIGDVSGHGLQAALLMVSARSLLRASLRTIAEPARIMELMNDVLVPDMVSGKFMSMFAAIIDPATGAVAWCNAGQPAPLLYSAANRTIRELGTCGPALGMFDDSDYDVGLPFTLQPGDAILAYTDGGTEARNAKDEFFGDHRVRALLMANAAGTPSDVIDAVRKAVTDFTGNPDNDDDFTVLALKYGTAAK